MCQLAGPPPMIGLSNLSSGTPVWGWHVQTSIHGNLRSCGAKVLSLQLTISNITTQNLHFIYTYIYIYIHIYHIYIERKLHFEQEIYHADLCTKIPPNRILNCSSSSQLQLVGSYRWPQVLDPKTSDVKSPCS